MIPLSLDAVIGHVNALCAHIGYQPLLPTPEADDPWTPAQLAIGSRKLADGTKQFADVPTVINAVPNTTPPEAARRSGRVLQCVSEPRADGASVHAR